MSTATTHTENLPFCAYRNIRTPWALFTYHFRKKKWIYPRLFRFFQYCGYRLRWRFGQF